MQSEPIFWREVIIAVSSGAKYAARFGSPITTKSPSPAKLFNHLITSGAGRSRYIIRETVNNPRLKARDGGGGEKMIIPNYITITQLTEPGQYIAYHPELSTILSQGETPKEAQDNLVEATKMALEHLKAKGLEVPSVMDFNGLTVNWR